MIDKIDRTLGGVREKVLAILGLTFKPNTDDMREAPSISIIRGLQRQGAQVRVFDPAGMKEAKKILKSVYYAKDAYDAGKGAHGLVIITEWNQFRNLDWKRMAKALAEPVVVDLRNIYEPEKMRGLGFRYTCVGRRSKP
jgi:UDPglucose 6-dehydrogenase